MRTGGNSTKKPVLNRDWVVAGVLYCLQPNAIPQAILWQHWSRETERLSALNHTDSGRVWLEPCPVMMCLVEDTH